MSQPLRSYTFIDLFAGIGGFHQAMKAFGAKCLFASEWDTHAAKTYEENYGIKPQGDITKIDEKEIPSHDILCGGFPCQAFSIAGKQKGFEDTRGTLFFDIARIVSFHKPKILFLENVKNFAQHNGGQTINTVVSTLVDLNYDVYYNVLNSSNYALPQNRERVYFVCFRRDLSVTKFKFPRPLEKRTSLFDILEQEPKDAKTITRTDVVIKKEYTPTSTMFGELDLPNRPIQIGIVNKGGQGERIYSPYGHAITLSAYGGGAGAKTGLYKIGNLIRKLSPRECARLQGFPDTYKIPNSTTQAYKQFGNSVSVGVLKEIVNAIAKAITNG